MVSLSNKSIRWMGDIFIIFIYESEPSGHRLVVILYIFIMSKKHNGKSMIFIVYN